MNKRAILSIALLSSLAGCNKEKKQPKYVAQKQSSFSIDMPLAHTTPADITEDSEVLSFFDEDLGEFAFADEEDATEYAQSTTARDTTTLDERNITAWIDNAQEDSELKTIYFGFNKYGVTPDQKEIIETDIAVLADLLEIIDEDALIVIEGHSCHSAGSAAYNMGLSEKRAKYIRDLFVHAGIEASRIRVIGRGQEVPALVDGRPVTGDREQQGLNRRVEIRIVEQA